MARASRAKPANQAFSSNAAELSPFEGQRVLGATVAITNAGDGLSKAMKVERGELHIGNRVYVVLECDVSKVRFDPVKDAEGLNRVHVLRAGRATMVEADLVQSLLDEQQVRIEKAAGIERIPFGGGEPEGGPEA